jgi:hypothetical protein
VLHRHNTYVGKLTLSVDPVTPLLARLRAELKGVSLDPDADTAKRRRRLLRRVAQGEADVRDGRTVPQEKVFKALRARLAGK